MKDDAGRIQACLLDLLARRAPEASICPSEVARHLAGDDGPWRDWMAPVRSLALGLAEAGVLEITQGTSVITPKSSFRGPIRLRRGPRFESK